MLDLFQFLFIIYLFLFGGKEGHYGGLDKRHEDKVNERAAGKKGCKLLDYRVFADKIHHHTDGDNDYRAGKYRGHRLNRRIKRAFLAVFGVFAVFLKGVGEKYGVVHGAAQLYAAYDDVDHEVYRLSHKLSYGEVYPYAKLDEDNENNAL